jgi:diguanylate cyclase (GGDEF)-like protein/PAS domain S-box-containing protein
MSHGSASERVAAVIAHLAAHPGAWVGAINRSARYVPLPAAIPGGLHPRLEEGFALNPVHPEDRMKLSLAYRERDTTGVVAQTVRFAAGGTGTYTMFALRDLFEVDVIVVDTHGGGNPTAGPGASTPMASRFCRIIRDERGRTIEIDEAAPRVLGISADDLLTTEQPLSRIHPAHHETIVENWMATMANETDGHRCRVQIIRGDGSIAWMEITNFNRLEDPDRPHVISEMLDISEEMAAHEEVAAREQLLHRLAEALPLGVVQLDPMGYVVYKNDFLSDILGVDWAMTMDEQFRCVIEGDRPLLTKAFAVALDNGGDDDVVVRVKVSAFGAERIVRLTTKSLRGPDGDHAGVIACVSDVTEATLMGRELERRATFDALTGCFNRAAILTRLSSAIADGGSGVAALFLDLDGFKEINDRDGHASGDSLLQTAARLLADSIRPSDVVGRLGGDEFLVVCQDVGGPKAALALAERVASIVRESVRASIGVAWAAPGSIDADHLVQRADEAMYESKREAEGRPHLWREDLASA